MARVLVIGDTHCPVMLSDYVSFLKQVEAEWACDTVVHIGDVADFNAISYHEKNPATPAPEDEYRQALSQVQSLYKAFNKVTVMTGNHDALPKRQARSAGIPTDLVKDYGQIWKTPDWNWLPRYSVHDIDGVKYAHGDRGKGGQMAALKNAKDHFCSWVQGHLHSQAGVTYFANEDAMIFGMSVGCGVDRHTAAMDYGIKFTSKPIIGCGVVIDGVYAVFEPMRLD